MVTLQEKLVYNFANCHEDPDKDPDIAGSFTVEKPSDNTGLYLVVTLTSKEIPKTEKIEPCFDLRDPRSSELISTNIPIVSIFV